MSLPSPFSRASRIERQAYKWVMNMLDDPGRHARALERWFRKDPDHRAIYKRVAVEVGYASDAALQIPALRVDPARDRHRAPWTPTGAFYLAAGVAALVIGLLIYMLAWQSIRPAWLPQTPSKPPTELVSTESGTKSLKLADGSSITLLGGGALNISYTSSERAIILRRGRARFEVAHDVARPFVVYVGGGKVTAVGTVFEVSADRQVSVLLLSGRVRVSLPAASGALGRPDVTLSSGQQIGFDNSTNAYGPTAAIGGSQNRPRQTQSFDDVPVSAVIDQVNRASAQKVILLDKETAERKIFADLDIGDADAVSRKLAPMFGLSIDRSVAGQIRLTEKK